MANLAKLLAAAKQGDVDTIWKLAGSAGGDDGGDDDGDDDDDGGDDEADVSEVDELAYKWLLVAADFGHEAADDAADDMLETSSLRYDDGQLVQGLIEFELGEAYLTGADGLPIDFEHAKTHLEQAKALEVDRSTDIAKTFPALRKKLSREAQAVFEQVFPDSRVKAADLPPKPKRPV